MFINFSNHPSKNWSKEQTEQAQQYGKILDAILQLTVTTGVGPSGTPINAQNIHSNIYNIANNSYCITSMYYI